MSKTNFEELAASLLRDAPRLVRQWLPNGKLEANEWCCGSVKGDKGRSFKVNIHSGKWADFADKLTGGDLISLYKEIHQLPTMLDAAKALSGVQDEPSNSTYEPKVVKSNDVIEVIPEDLRPPILSIEGYSYKTSWEYRNADGHKIYIVQRYENDKGKKEIRPWRFIDGKFTSKQLPKPRPLFNLNLLEADKSKRVLIVEGEKAAAAATVFEAYIPTTWPMGSNNVQNADWSALHGRADVLIIPDADKAGYEAALWLGKHLTSKQKVTRVSVVDTRSKPDGWDIADDAEEGISVRDTAAYIKSKMMTLEVFEAELFPKDAIVESKRVRSMEEDPDPIGAETGSFGHFVPEANIVDVGQNPYFRFLGFRHEQFYFYIYKTGQVISFGPKNCGEEAYLVMIAPPEYWSENFQNNWKAARVAIIGISQEVRFSPRKVRKLGIYMDDDKPVAHLGEFLMFEQGVVPLKAFRSKYVYEYSEHRLEMDRLAPPATNKQAEQLIAICNGSNWMDNTHGQILAGWMFMSLFCASLRWRSHLYLIGPAGSGKTWLIDNVVDKFFREFKYKAGSSSTEASIRQGLNNNMIPVVLDEAEAEDSNANLRRKSIFDLARFASAATEDTPITKGGIASSTKEYFVRSPFLFASINASMEYADESRTTFLKLAPLQRNHEKRAVFKEHELFTRRVLTRDYTCSMIRRAVTLLPKVVETYEVFVDACLIEIAQDTRQAEQMSYYITGLWFLKYDIEPTMEQASEFVKVFVSTASAKKSTLSSEAKLLTMISQIKVETEHSGKIVKRTVGELAQLAVLSGRVEDLDKQHLNASLALRRAGIMVDNTKKGFERFYILNESTIIRQGLYGSAFYPTWDKVLSRVKKAEEHENIDYLGCKGPSVSIPLKEFIGDIKTKDSAIDNFFE
jgi:hypothetical protein